MWLQGTIRNYCHPEKDKRHKLGGHIGRRRLLDSGTAQVLVDTIRRHDRANQGKGLPEIIGTIQEIKPELDRKQARNTYDKTVKKDHKKELTGIVKAQATTTKRSGITVEQQWRWHTLVDSMWNEIIELNKEEGEGGVPESWKVQFYTIMQHFCANGDEEGIAVNAGSVSKLFVSDLKAIAHAHFMQTELKGKKVDCVKQLELLIRNNPNTLPLATAEAQRNAAE